MNKKKKPISTITELPDSLIYIRPQQDGCKAKESTKIVFSFPPGPNTEEFKLLCTRMAQSLGYPQSAIDKCFGPIEEEDEEQNWIVKELNTESCRKI